jgi:hypothetical protein
VPNDEFDDKARTVKAFRIRNLAQQIAELRGLLDNLIILYMEQNPSVTFREAAQKFGMDKMMVWRIIQRKATGQVPNV